jgi:cytochrome d ubiquinol oxidase subunit II
MNLLQIIWFFLVFLLFAIYSILDGFDLGVGFWYIFAKDSEEKSERRVLLHTIEPFWDGNEVWLLLAGGVILIAFRDVYATIFSGFYLPVMILIFCLIFRAVSIEFRNEIKSPSWYRFWDIGFIAGSIIPSFLFGVVMGNILRGLEIDASKNYGGTLFDLLNPFAILIGLLAVAMFASHGAFYLILRTKDPIAEKARTWAKLALYAYLVLYALAFIFAFILEQKALGNYITSPLLLVIPLFGLLTILGTYYFWDKKEELKAFISSSISIGVAFLVCAIAIYPNLIPAMDSTYSLTIEDTASTDFALLIYLVIALIGLPIVFIFFIWTYRLYRGKIGLDEAIEGY